MEVAHMSQPSSQPQVPSQAPKKAKKIFLYRNGLAQDGKVMVINDRVVRDFSTLLTYATSGLKAPVAIRNLYTPQNGHRVGNLDDLHSGQVYGAAGQEKFKKIKYGVPKLLPKRRGNPYVMVPSRRDQAVVASARYKKPTLKPFYIHVFRNGDENFRGVRVLLTQRTLYSMDHVRVLELVMEKAELFTSASRLCNMDGTPVKALSQLENGKQYVAIEGNKPFKKVRYSTHDTITESKRIGDGSQGTSKTKPFTSGGYLAPHPPPSKPVVRVKKFTREERPLGGRKDKEKREKALEDQRADSVFGAPKRKPKQALLVTSQLLHDQVEEDGDNKSPLEESPLLQYRTNSIDTHVSTLPETSGHQNIFHASERTVQSPIKSYKEETTSGVFKSKLESSEIQAAEDVHEAQDIEVEHPIDHVQAQEVEELPVDNKADIAPIMDHNKSVSTPASTKQHSPLQSPSGQLSPTKKTVSHSCTNSKLSSKSGDSLGASSGHNSPKTHSNNATKVSSRTGDNDSKQSKRSNDTTASKKSRTSHHGDT